MTTAQFDDINITTMTIIVSTNLEINLDWFYNALPVSTLNSSGSIKTNKEFQKHTIRLNPPHGTVTMAEYKNKLKGFKMVKKKKKFFRNALSIVMYVGKLITIKIPTKGSLQMTGCISQDHSEWCIKYLWSILAKHSPSPQSVGYDALTYRLTNEKPLYCTLRTVMTDIVFKLGFYVNRQNLDRYMNRCTEFNSLLETSFGYTGVNIKIPFQIDQHETRIKILRIDDTGVWRESFISYDDYVATLPEKDQQKELAKKRRNTFLVFHSGTAIMSGMTVEYMKHVYEKFMSIIKNARPEIEEVIIKEI